MAIYKTNCIRFPIKLNLNLSKIQTFENVSSWAPFSQLGHMIQAFHSESNAFHEKVCCDFVTKKGTFVVLKEDSTPIFFNVFVKKI